MTSISVAMATFNGGERLQRQLVSLAEQTHLPTELVIGDDKSDDDTLAITARFAKTAPFPVRIHSNDCRLGYRRNFMNVAGLCGSELIAFCDQDDYWHADKIEAAIKPFVDPDVVLSYHNATIVTSDGRDMGLFNSPTAQRTVFEPLQTAPFFFALGFTQVFRRSLMNLTGLWPSSKDYREHQPLAHDQWFFFLASVFGKIAALDDTLADWMQHERNAGGWRRITGVQRLKRFFRNRADEIYRFAEAAENRALILDKAKLSLADAEWRVRAECAAERYRGLAELYGDRGRLYSTGNLMRRFSAFTTLSRKSGYQGAWGFGRNALLADACLGVPVGPALPTMDLLI